MSRHFDSSVEMEKDSHKEIFIKLGKRIRQLRKARNKTQLDLEFDCKINHGDISRIENGQKNVELLTIIKLADALKVTVSDLFKEDVE